MGVPPGAKCFGLNPEVAPGEDHCSRCQANLALKSGETVCSEETTGGKRVIGYWMPLKEVPDVYVHFGIGTAPKAMAAPKRDEMVKL
jgi:predicted nucleic acid-binding Zn ribbon protein